MFCKGQYPDTKNVQAVENHRTNAEFRNYSVPMVTDETMRMLIGMVSRCIQELGHDLKLILVSAGWDARAGTQ